MFTRRIPLDERLFRRVDATGPCWLWTGARNDAGYGVIRDGDTRRLLYTHRVAWELLVGTIPSDLQIDHLCRVRHCCNPDHLEPVTRSVNVRRSSAVSQMRQCTCGYFISRDGQCSRSVHQRVA